MKFINQSAFIDTVLPKIDSRVVTVAKNIALVFSFALITAICSQIKVEIGAVPITMQTFAVLLSGALLGSKKGALSQLTYLFLGFAGIPWFARGGGMGYIMSPTFGYILGFVLVAFVIGFLCERGFDRKIQTAILAMIIASVFFYIPGLLWLSRFVGFEKVLSIGFFPFILGDLLKISFAGLLLPLFWKIIGKGRKQ